MRTSGSAAAAPMDARLSEPTMSPRSSTLAVWALVMSHVRMWVYGTGRHKYCEWYCEHYRVDVNTTGMYTFAQEPEMSLQRARTSQLRRPAQAPTSEKTEVCGQRDVQQSYCRAS